MTRPFSSTARLLLLVAAASAGATAQSQSGLPATAPTQAAQANSVAPLTATPTLPTTSNHAHRAEVRYASGMLSVNANNSSLNLILREISRQTGMKITGGVGEQRVFGHYGPAEPAEILVTLLDGTGTNVLLRQNDVDAPLELVLTPRNGGVTPPNPNAPGFDDPGVEQPEPSDQPPPAAPQPAPVVQQFTNAAAPDTIAPQNTYPPVQSGTPAAGQPLTGAYVTSQPQPNTSANPSIPLPANNINGSSANVTPTASQIPTTDSVPLDTLATPSTTPPTAGIVDTPNPANAGVVNPIQQNAQAIGAAAGNGQPVSAPAPDASLPAGAKTPEQIFQQLQQMRQQQQQQQSGSTTTTATPTTPQ